MNVQEIMTKPAVTCRQTDTLNIAAQLMWDHDCGAIPVVNDGGGAIGVITDRDICMAAYTQGRPLAAISVAKAMAKQVFSCRPDDPLHVVEKLMSDKQVRRIPVVDANNRPIGVVSFNDIVRYASSSRKKSEFDHEVVQTLAAICQRRPQRSTTIQAEGQAASL